MKSIFKHIFPVMGVALLAAGCSENAWNDKLDGFEEPGVATKSETVAYTLTDANYKQLASLSRNKTLAEQNNLTDQLAAIGNNATFTSQEEARMFIPAFLRDSVNFPYFTLNDGSSVSVTYNLTTSVPEEVQKINAGCDVYTVSEADYQNAWGSNDDFIPAFAPMTPASKALPGILASQYPNAKAGDFAIVNYAESDTNPIFGTVGGGGGETGTWEATSVLENVSVGDEVEVKGWVTGIDTRGFVLSDLSGSILCYQSSGFDVNSVAIGNQVTVSATVSSYGTALQLPISDGSYTVGASDTYSYPNPTEYSGVMFENAVARSTDELAEYVCFNGVCKISGNYINFELEDAGDAMGSGYMVTDAIKAQLEDGKAYTVYGWFVSVSSSKYFNVVITSVEAAAAGKRTRAIAYAPANEVVTNNAVAVYKYDGSKWSQPSNTYALQTADYNAMGQTYGNLSGTGPDTYLPVFLKNKFPYAAADDIMTIVYKYYDGSATTFRAVQYSFNGSEWVKNMGQTTDKFTRRNGYWNFNPSVDLVLPYARNTDPSYTVFMACVSWVWDNICVPMGNTEEMLANKETFVDYRKNAEYYSGASAYYGNVDIRSATALSYAPKGYTGYEGMSGEQITELLKKRFCTQVLPGALKSLYPDANVVEGMDVTYTVTFTAYTGSAEEVTAVYKVTGPAQFEYVSSTWVSDQTSQDWLANPIPPVK